MKLNLGCGAWKLDGYENWDRETGQEAFPLAVPRGSCEEIRASHVLEHFSHRETLMVLHDWVSALAPGGVLKVAVPDFDQIVRQYQQYDGTGEAPMIESWLLGGHRDDNDWHGSLFTEAALRQAFEALGLENIQRWSDISDCSSLPISLNLQGNKPLAAAAPEAGPALPPNPGDLPEQSGPIEIEAGAIKAVMSCPRLGFTDNMRSIIRMTHKLGLQFETCSGVFWGQSLTKMLERRLTDGTRYVLTLDYDSVFQPEDIVELTRIMELRPDIDAVCAVQMRRDGDSPLMTTEAGNCTPRPADVSLRDLAADTMRIRTGHFGLTLIRMDSLRKLPAPWFLHTPGPTGHWDDDRMDEDIHFWHKWGAAGFSLHQANRVVIGHAQLLITWPSRGLKPLHQFTKDYDQLGKPGGAWR